MIQRDPAGPSRTRAHRREEEKWKQGGGWRPRTAEHPALEICFGSTNLPYMMLWRIGVVGKQRKAEYVERLEIPATCGTQGSTSGCCGMKERRAV